MTQLKLYNVTDEYINYLRQFDNKVFSNKEENRVHERKYLGILLAINEFNYFVPLSSPKKSDYIVDKGIKHIRKSNVPIIRMTDKNNKGELELKGTLKFSNMIPIPKCALVDYDLDNENDIDYKILVAKELRFITSNSDKIIKNAKVMYNQKTKGFEINYLDNTIDFKFLEEKCKEYEDNINS